MMRKHVRELENVVDFSWVESPDWTGHPHLSTNRMRTSRTFDCPGVWAIGFQRWRCVDAREVPSPFQLRAESLAAYTTGRARYQPPQWKTSSRSFQLFKFI